METTTQTKTESEILNDLDNEAAAIVDALREYLARIAATEGQIGRTRPHGRALSFETNRKYHRVFSYDGSPEEIARCKQLGMTSSRSVLVFVDRMTGDMWAPHGWKAPSKTYAGNVLALCGRKS